MDVPADSGLVDTGPTACLSGRLQLVIGQLGMSSQVLPQPSCKCYCDTATTMNPNCCVHRAIASAIAAATACKHQMPVLSNMPAQQVVFRLPAELREQVLGFSAVRWRYEALDAPRALDAAQLALLLPASIAMQACKASANFQACSCLHSWSACVEPKQINMETLIPSSGVDRLWLAPFCDLVA